MRSTDVTVSSEWVKRISHFYLLIPFLIFCLGFMKPFLSIPIALILAWLVARERKRQGEAQQGFSLSRRVAACTILAVLLWVALSGIGSFAFQNTDFHTRNAIFHDLINYDWPVKYHTSLVDRITGYGLTYYVGYWLPAALIGKSAGWQAANIALYLWTVTGILLTVFVLFSSRKSRPGYFVLVLIFFSGMDALGTLLVEWSVLSGKISPSLWPPLMHLEWWMPGFQFSSFTTQLFWVFNQAIPAWLCMALLWTASDRKAILLIWSLCVFFAPLPALGMLPYLILKIPKELINPENLKDKDSFDSSKPFLSRLWCGLRSLMTQENMLGGGVVLLTTYLHFSGNRYSADLILNTISPADWLRYVAFLVLEGLLLWWILGARNKANLNWYLAGFLILAIPLIKVGSTQEFCMRASIPTLFMLMVWSAEMLATPKSAMRTVLIILLSIGAIAPIYEINRSLIRTAFFYLNLPPHSETLSGQEMRIYIPASPEYDHPFTLAADSFKSLANFGPDELTYYATRLDHSFFYKYLAK